MLDYAHKIVFADFEIFYSFVQDLPGRKSKKLFNFKWSSETIRAKFQNFFLSTRHTNKKALKGYFSCNVEQPYKWEFWTERGWSKEEAIEKVSKLQKANQSKVNYTTRLTVSQLEYYLKKGYSEEEALLLQQEHQRKAMRGAGRFLSKSSRKLFEPFLEKYGTKFTIKFGAKGDELRLFEKRFFYYDFAIMELKLIFEFNGTHIHPNPAWPKERWNSWRHLFTKIGAEEAYAFDCLKNRVAISQGYTVIVLWDGDKNNTNIVESEIEKARIRFGL
jgi:hypothetical protein